MLPPGWTLNELQGIDSYVGEVVGDGMRLVFDYGRFGWNLTPEDEPEHEYIVSYEDIGGREAKLLLAVDSPASSTAATYQAATGVALRRAGWQSDLHAGGARADARAAACCCRHIPQCPHPGVALGLKPDTTSKRNQSVPFAYR